MPQEFDVVCLAGGVAGEAIAAGLQNSGLTLAVVERELVGGECPYWGCVPSKTLLRSGETLTEADRSRLLAASRVEWTVDFPKVSTRVLWMARNLDDSRPAAAMEATGATLLRGEGTLMDPRTVVVGSEQLVARRAVVIANGSTAAIPPIPGLDKIRSTHGYAALSSNDNVDTRTVHRRAHRFRARPLEAVRQQRRRVPQGASARPHTGRRHRGLGRRLGTPALRLVRSQPRRPHDHGLEPVGRCVRPQL